MILQEKNGLAKHYKKTSKVQGCTHCEYNAGYDIPVSCTHTEYNENCSYCISTEFG